MRTSTRSAFLACRHVQALNPIEPPWYGPVCPVVWEGRRREASPYPDQSQGPRSSRRPSGSNPVAHERLVADGKRDFRGIQDVLPNDTQSVPMLLSWLMFERERSERERKRDLFISLILFFFFSFSFLATGSGAYPPHPAKGGGGWPEFLPVFNGTRF